jgi:hypothetical protein
VSQLASCSNFDLLRTSNPHQLHKKHNRDEESIIINEMSSSVREFMNDNQKMDEEPHRNSLDVGKVLPELESSAASPVPLADKELGTVPPLQS